MRTNTILGVAGAVLTVAAVAFAINTGGGLGGMGPGLLRCLILYELLLIMILIWLVQCVRHCDPESGLCNMVCYRRALIMWILSTSLLFVCIGTHPF